MGENITIRELVYNQFSMRPLHEKLRIVNKGRPTPPLPNVITHHKTKTNTQDIFAPLDIRKVDWLAGCEMINFTVDPVYFFLTNMKYGTNRVSRI
jgi:hypothetical protein